MIYFILSYSPFCTSEMLQKEKRKLINPLPNDKLKIYKKLKYLCNTKYIKNGTEYNIIEEKVMAMQIRWYEPLDGKWHYISSVYMGGGYYKQLYVDETGTKFIEVHAG